MNKTPKKSNSDKSKNKYKDKQSSFQDHHDSDLEKLSGTAQVVPSRDLFTKLKSWSRSQLLSPFTAGAGCCARELLRLEGPNPQSHMIREKLNNERVERCDVLIVSGVINPKLRPYLQRVYERMLSPKFCVAVGTCAATGAIFDTIAVNEIIPVDVYIPGCPPSMDALVHGVEILRKRVAQGLTQESEYRASEASL